MEVDGDETKEDQPQVPASAAKDPLAGMTAVQVLEGQLNTMLTAPDLFSKQIEETRAKLKEAQASAALATATPAVHKLAASTNADMAKLGAAFLKETKQHQLKIEAIDALAAPP